MTYFKNLLNKVLEGTETPEEYDEFLTLYQSGEHDDELTAEDVRKVVSNYQARELGLEYIVAADALDGIRSRIKSRKQPVHRYRSKVWLMAATVSLTLMFGLWYMAKDSSWFRQAAKQEKTNLARFAGKQVVDLPDGTKVILNENSELNFKRPFGKANREVNLVGEASFDVAHDAEKPFLVHTGKITTKVLGTEFNVKAYPDQTEITVTVLRGLVEVRGEEKIYGQIRPNEQIAVNTTTNDFVQQETNAEEAVKWKSAFLILMDMPLEEAAGEIEKKFSVQIKFENESIKKCVFAGTFLNDESLEQVLSIMTTVVGGVEYKIEGSTVTLSGEGCE